MRYVAYSPTPIYDAPIPLVREAMFPGAHPDHHMPPVTFLNATP